MTKWENGVEDAQQKAGQREGRANGEGLLTVSLALLENPLQYLVAFDSHRGLV